MVKTTNQQKSVALILGGRSAEREISLKTGAAVKQALKALGHHVTELDPAIPLLEFITALEKLKPDVCFNALHGTWGEDGGVQTILEILRIPYTHSGRFASSLAMHKIASLSLLQAHNLPVAKNYSITQTEIQKNPAFQLPLPLVVKPVFQGSSVGLYIIKEKSQIPDFSNWNFGLAMVEEYIDGLELTTAILEDVDGKPKALTVTELKPNSGVYDYVAKYTTGQTLHICPAEIPPDLFQQCKDLAIQCHQYLGCSGVSRVDFRYDPKKKQLVILELNTQPGMTDLSLVPEQAAALGISFTELISIILQNAKLKE